MIVRNAVSPDIVLFWRPYGSLCFYHHRMPGNKNMVAGGSGGMTERYTDSDHQPNYNDTGRTYLPFKYGVGWCYRWDETPLDATSGIIMADFSGFPDA